MTPIMSAENNKTLVSRFHEDVFGKRDLSRINEVIAPDFVQYLPGATEPIRGPEGFGRWVAGLFEAFPDLEVPVEEILSEDERVVTRYLMRGTHQGSLMDIPPTGKRVEVAGMNVIRLSEGRLIEKRDEYDLFGLLKQLGALPSRCREV
jgi:steroid delta-isomerase-like uncharacterized protein